MRMSKKSKIHVEHLRGFGMVTEIRNQDGLTATIVMDSPEISRFLGALNAYLATKNRESDKRAMEALTFLEDKFSTIGHEYLRITADCVMAVHGVKLEPIELSEEEIFNMTQKIAARVSRAKRQ
jgi:hypothetical protein